MSLILGSLAMIAAVWWYYTRQRETIEAARFRELAAVADVVTTQITSWRRERLGDGRILLSSPVMRVARRVLSSPNPTAADRADLLEVMGRLAREFLYTDVTLVDLDGQVRIRLDMHRTESSQLLQRTRRELALEAGKANEVMLSDLSLDTRTGRPLMSLTIPVRDAGALIFDIDPATFLHPYLKAWPGPSRTGEMYLVRRQGDEMIYLSELRHRKTAWFYRRPLPAGIPSDAVLDAGWTTRVVDYRGIPVLATVRWIRDSSWFLVCKIDAAEVIAPVRRLGWMMALITALIGLANAAGVGFIWRDQRARMLATEVAEQNRKEREIRALSARLIDAQEDERKRLARELHDDLNQQIAAMSIAMGNLKRRIPENQADLRGQSDGIHKKLVQLAETVRRMSHELHPAALQYSGLASALQAYCNEFAELTGIRVSLQTHGSFDGVPSAVALCVYRITQEALQNVAKHAKVGAAAVELSRSDGFLRLTISDAGKGMEPARAEAATGLGLVSIRERTRLVRGSVEITSRPNQGTKITVKIPTE
jgi:signal transduction histidine kinase